MKTIHVIDCTPTVFAKKVTEAIASRSLGKIVNISATDSQILVKFSKLGSSEIIYECLASLPAGFKATLKSEKIAFAHRVFRADIEAKLAAVMEKQGAQIN